MNAPRPEPMLQPIDLLLAQGDAKELASARARLAEDPLAALELAETIDLVERLREVRTAPSPTFGLRMRQVTVAARRRLVRRRRQRQRRDVLWFALAAAAMFAALLLWHPADRTPTGSRGHDVVAGLPAPQPMPPVADTDRPQAPPGDVAAAIRDVAARLEALRESRLAAGLARLQAHPLGDALQAWLQPQQLCASLRLDFELRADAALRLRALQLRGGTPVMADRIQELAAGIATDATAGLAAGRLDLATAAFAARALAAAGTAGPGGAHHGVFTTLLVHLGNELREPGRVDGARATGLYALAELGAGTGGNLEYVQQATTALARDLLLAANWDRARPQLLQSHTPAWFLADAGRLLQLAPAFGVDADLACRARVLLAAHLEERRQFAADDPALLAAQVYGFADLCDRDAIDQKLRGWRSSELAPDFLTLQQLAWSREVGGRGFARFQLDLRALAAVPAPPDLRDRGALLLCLATDIAAPGLSALAAASPDEAPPAGGSNARTGGRGN